MPYQDTSDTGYVKREKVGCGSTEFYLPKAVIAVSYTHLDVYKRQVLNQTDKVLMVLRPYQYYAAEAIVERVRLGQKNGYIWHTTGSGKTLTSFKTSQLLLDNPRVHKVVFVVDRRDLDYQTTREFNSLSLIHTRCV